ncbi:phosphoribosylformylglycinamidine synthase [Ascoidea rubescens DSM 1968]|uniref:Phosphoribosylformylglycinamidine synthase n=1 Tax=Ascoidea rubescens DSM 1968 TaxID=1344418 RepID=A0A1D2VM51_9ASCO|nr:phosphoribosylformylglycinamidin [Ascoidea rubescens DSM 1968]ODV62696.1 phosphoribosylformylglycinamidin [Ascoidea rubescens DSM 1968]
MKTTNSVFIGGNALSSFRINKIITDINLQFATTGNNLVSKIDSTFVHYVSLSRAIDDTELKSLTDLLDYDTIPVDAKFKNIMENVYPDNKQSAEFDKSGFESNNSLLITIVPRSGTISPWSSKATNIAQVCGLDGFVERVERGLTLLFQLGAGDGNGNTINSSNIDHLKLISSLESIYDRMTQSIFINSMPELDQFLFTHHKPKPLVYIDLLGSSDPKGTLQKTNIDLGLSLNEYELNYLIQSFVHVLKRNPSDVELFMFAQVNSEHCRHKIFNANWKIDGVAQVNSLFDMIRNTHRKSPQYTISAYSDNAAVFEGHEAFHYSPNIKTKTWKASRELVHTLIKVETHNHPTAVSPFPGAATGSGGEIRDEAAVGKGSKTKAGMSGYNVSDLNIPGFVQPWELDVGKPNHIASALEIMIQAPLGSAAFNNEFGRPCIAGYFRTLTSEIEAGEDGSKQIKGYHKPIMLAGGMGAIRPNLTLKDNSIKANDLVIVLGGESMLIGLGGGAASSKASGEGSADLDFASVQRGNPEMQRRCQQVIDACVFLGDMNPILSIHDVGAGGLSNALPELVHDNDLGAVFELRKILSLEPGMSPMEIWCNESQERYVLAIDPKDLEFFEGLCKRERAPFSVVGKTTSEKKLLLVDELFGNTPIDLEMSVLFGKAPKLEIEANTKTLRLPEETSDYSFVGNGYQEALEKVLQLPSVGSKSFLITIGDRSITGLVDRDQFVGPYQVPVSNVGVTCSSLYPEGKTIKTGEALSIGEKPLLALISPSASAQMAVAESLLNIFSANISSLNRVKLSANWMVAPGSESELYEAVKSIGMDLCPELGISIPVGKDSMSMKMKWENKEVSSPLSLVITAFAPVQNTGLTWTPTLQHNLETILVLVDLSTEFKKSLGGSALFQVYKQTSNSCPKVHDKKILKGFILGLIGLHKHKDLVLAYHDRSDGGLIVTLLEMAFAARCGLDINVFADTDANAYEYLFNEELGGVFQIAAKDFDKFENILNQNGIPSTYIQIVGKPHFSSDGKPKTISVVFNNQVIINETRSRLQQLWTSTSYEIQKLRDNPQCAKEEFENINDDADPGLSYTLTYNPADNMKICQMSSRPKVAILREQGVNGQQEMAWCFEQAGFTSVDVHMSDLLSKNVELDDFVGIAACGGFSYGDVLGAGNGWATSVLYHPQLRSEFKRFFNDRSDTFAFGACNGCQFLSRIAEVIPGTEDWPVFERNTSEQYEARFCMVEIKDEDNENINTGKNQKSIFLDGMSGSRLPIAVAHGEGRAGFGKKGQYKQFEAEQLGVVRYVDNYGKVTERYPFNPNGSPGGITGIKSPNGRVLAMMPHPERVCRKEANSWYPSDENWGDYGPWIRLFRSARRWVN